VPTFGVEEEQLVYRWIDLLERVRRRRRHASSRGVHVVAQHLPNAQAAISHHNVNQGNIGNLCRRPTLRLARP